MIRAQTLVNGMAWNETRCATPPFENQMETNVFVSEYALGKVRTIAIRSGWFVTLKSCLASGMIRNLHQINLNDWKIIHMYSGCKLLLWLSHFLWKPPSYVCSLVMCAINVYSNVVMSIVDQSVAFSKAIPIINIRFILFNRTTVQYIALSYK